MFEMPDKKNTSPPRPEFWPVALRKYRMLFAYHVLLTGCVFLSAALVRLLLISGYLRVGNPFIMVPILVLFGQMLNHVKSLEHHAACRFPPWTTAAIAALNLVTDLFIVAFGYPYMRLFQHGVLDLSAGAILFMAQCFTAVYYIFELRKKNGDDPWKNTKSS